MSLASLEWGRLAGSSRRKPFGGLIIDVPLLVILLTCGQGKISMTLPLELLTDPDLIAR